VLTEPKWETETTTPGAAIAVGHLSQGFLLPADRYAFVTEEEIFGEKRHRRRSRPRPVADYLTGLSQLSAGDFVVHVDHGIAKYQGLRHLSVGARRAITSTWSTRAAIVSICRSNVST